MSAPVLLADIGGTHARLALFYPNSGLEEGGASLWCVEKFRCADFGRIQDVIRAYLMLSAVRQYAVPEKAVLAVAAPIDQSKVRFTNSGWEFDTDDLADELKLSVKILNDFEAQAYALAWIHHLPVRWLQVAAAHSEYAGLRTIAGPGTGFGAASLSRGGEVISCEPGHVAFAPQNQEQVRLLSQLWSWYPRVTVEHLVSGPGIANIYAALSTLGGQPMTPHEAPTPETISWQLIEDKQSVGSTFFATNTMSMFSSILGAVCGDLALAHGCRGAFLVSGQLIASLGRGFDERLFLQSFHDKAQYADWCRAIPVGVLQSDWPGLQGCAAWCCLNR
jgi:glucokinase